MKITVTFVLLVLFFKNVSGQQQASRDTSISAVDISNLTVMLYQPMTEKRGAATIIKHQGRYYILTANHIAESMAPSAKVIFRVGNDQPGIIDLILFTKGRRLQWLHHSTADISMMELIPFNDATKKRLSETSFPSTSIVPDVNIPAFQFDFTYLGFPVIELDMKHFSPLFFNSHGASGLITQPRLDKTYIKCDFFYLDKPSMEGCSGSGVFISVSNKVMFTNYGKTYLMGVIHGTQGDNTGGKLAMVTPAYYIYDLLKKL